MARLVTLVLTGLLLAVAYQQMVVGKPETSKARAGLVNEVRQRQRAADGLQDRADDLREEVDKKRDRAVAGDSDADALRSRAAEAGLGRVAGDGVSVRLADARMPVDPVTGKQTGDNPGKVQDRDLQDVTNALWRLGAEAISINDQRLTAITTIRAAGGAILVDYRPLSSPYRVVAVGPDNIAERFEKSATAARFRRYVETYRMGFEIKERSGLKLPAAAEPQLRYASPANEASASPGAAERSGSQVHSGSSSATQSGSTPAQSGSSGATPRSPSATSSRPSVRSGSGGTS